MFINLKNRKLPVLGCTKKKIYLLWRKHDFFWKKVNVHYLIQIEISNVSLSFFSCFKDFFFNSKCKQLKELPIAHLSVVPIKEITSSGADTLFFKKLICNFFIQVEISSVIFSLFSYFRDFLFHSDSDHVEELSFTQILSVRKQKTTIWGARTQILKIITFLIYEPNWDLKG